MKVYMWIDTSDEYLLPMAVTTSVPELARIVGVPANTIYSYISHSVKKNYKKRMFIAVDIDDD